MARNAKLLSTRSSKAVIFPTSVNTLGELKAEIEKLDNNNNLHVGMQATLKSTGGVINDNDALPNDDFTVYFSPIQQKSGGNEDVRDIVLLYIKNNL